jgi:PKD repeat protein
MVRLVLLSALAIMLAGCAGSTPPLEHGLTLDEALAQLEALPTPDGLASAEFSALKSAFAASLTATGKTKFTTILPTGDSATIKDLGLSTSGSNQIVLSWTYRNKGDYDQNSETNINDLTALGANLGKTTGAPDWATKAVIADGDNNGEVNISDITPMGANFLGRVDGYRLEASTDPANEASWIQLGLIEFLEGEVSDPNPRLRFDHFAARPANPTSYRVRPVFEDEIGAPSNIVTFDPALLPFIDDVQPQSGITGTSVTFTPTLSGGAVESYDWNFGGGADPDTSTDPAPTVTLAGVGTYNASLTVANSLASDTYSFTLTVEPESTVVINGVTPLTGEQFADVQFVADITGTPDSWFWDFGSAGFPSQSVEATPTVNLLTLGPHDCTLTASDSVSGDSDVFQFTFEVLPSTAPPAVTDVSPTFGPAGTDVTFTASFSGNPPDTYSWDFGGGATPNTTTDVSPLVTLGAIGTYSASVTLTNANGSDTFNFDLEVVDPNSAPVIVEGSQAPVDGLENSVVTFSIQTTGGAVENWSWDFSNGEFQDVADPSTSTDPMPTVTLGGQNLGFVTVTVWNASGMDTYSFPVAVYPDTQ